MALESLACPVRRPRLGCDPTAPGISSRLRGVRRAWTTSRRTGGPATSHLIGGAVMAAGQPYPRGGHGVCERVVFHRAVRNEEQVIEQLLNIGQGRDRGGDRSAL